MGSRPDLLPNPPGPRPDLPHALPEPSGLSLESVALSVPGGGKKFAGTLHILRDDGGQPGRRKSDRIPWKSELCSIKSLSLYQRAFNDRSLRPRRHALRSKPGDGGRINTVDAIV